MRTDPSLSPSLRKSPSRKSRRRPREIPRRRTTCSGCPITRPRRLPPVAPRPAPRRRAVVLRFRLLPTPRPPAVRTRMCRPRRPPRLPTATTPRIRVDRGMKVGDRPDLPRAGPAEAASRVVTARRVIPPLPVEFRPPLPAAMVPDRCLRKMADVKNWLRMLPGLLESPEIPGPPRFLGAQRVVAPLLVLAGWRQAKEDRAVLVPVP